MDEIATGFETLRRLCAAALRGEISPAPIESDGVFAAQGLALAERHRVVPLLAAGLTTADKAGLSIAAGFREALRRRVLALAQQTVRLEQELAGMSAGLASVGVEFLVFKGPAIARQAYPVSDWRAYDDLDLWVESRDLDRAVRALEAAGYRRKEQLNTRAAACARRAGIEVALVHPGRGRLVEVAQGWPALAPSRRAANEILGAVVALEVGGARIRAPAPVHALLMACVHGAHHCWDRFTWLADVAGLWQRLTLVEREEACGIARRWRMETMLGLGLKLAADNFGLTLEGRPAALANSPCVQELARRVELEKIARDSLRVPMMARLRFENDARDSMVQRWRAMAGWLFTPTLGDIEARPLPEALYPLYALLRPVRLLRHPWRRDWRRLAGRT